MTVLEVLFVCSANRARSPAAALLLTRAQAARAGHVRVSSAGLTAREGEGWLPTMESELRRRGIDTPPHTTRRLLAEDLALVDLAVTMTEEQRRAVVRMGPARMLSRCFTLKELGRLLSSERWRREWNGGGADLTARLHEVRPLVSAAAEREDIADPAHGGPRRAKRVLGEIMVAVDRITPALTAQ